MPRQSRLLAWRNKRQVLFQFNVVGHPFCLISIPFKVLFGKHGDALLSELRWLVLHKQSVLGSLFADPSSKRSILGVIKRHERMALGIDIVAQLLIALGPIRRAGAPVKANFLEQRNPLGCQLTGLLFLVQLVLPSLARDPLAQKWVFLVIKGNFAVAVCHAVFFQLVVTFAPICLKRIPFKIEPIQQVNPFRGQLRRFSQLELLVLAPLLRHPSTQGWNVLVFVGNERIAVLGMVLFQGFKLSHPTSRVIANLPFELQVVQHFDTIRRQVRLGSLLKQLVLPSNIHHPPAQLGELGIIVRNLGVSVLLFVLHQFLVAFSPFARGGLPLKVQSFQQRNSLLRQLRFLSILQQFVLRSLFGHPFAQARILAEMTGDRRIPMLRVVILEHLVFGHPIVFDGKFSPVVVVVVVVIVVAAVDHG
mmetsp:Transcript_28635/g.78659  ORF Transcript_28635/g.78659 Transcript_28635/m.78659 type:complete len:420 (+) Transcript_28635:705-1964(+)